jgi:soluble calcium-activated nucleotidase 1
MVADLDARSRHPHQLQWHSYVTLGELTLPPLEPTDAAAHSAAAADTTAAAAAAAAAAGVGASVGVTWGATTEMTTSLAANNRSIELSDMVWFQGKFLTVCDYTGVVYKFRPQTGEIFPRFILADGDGKVARAFKSEWMTVYGPHLLVGSHGKEWVSGGKVIARGAEWVKVIQEGGKVSSVDWQHVYHRIRRAANATSPGYLSHEAVLWHEPARKWVFLPRKASHEQPFDDEADEQMGTNLLILVSEDLESSVEVLRVGPLEPEWGFASLARVPGSDLMLATKVREVGSETQTKLALFDLRGRMLFPGDGFVSVDADRKYEGIEFLGQFESI